VQGVRGDRPVDDQGHNDVQALDGVANQCALASTTRRLPRVVDVVL